MSKKNLLKCLLSIPEDEYSPRYHFFLLLKEAAHAGEVYQLAQEGNETEGFRSHLLMNYHVQLTARRGYGYKFFIASQQPATLWKRIQISMCPAHCILYFVALIIVL